MQEYDTALTLAIACEDDRSAIVATLLKAGANPNVSNLVRQKLRNIFCRILLHFLQRGQTPLLLATRKKNIVMVKELVEAEVDVNHMEEVSVISS